MDEGFSKSILVKLGVAILVIALVDLFFLNYWVFKSEKLKVESEKVEEAKVVNDENSPLPSPTSQPFESPSPTAEPALAATETKTVVEKETVVQTAQKEIFIPIGSGSTKSGTFADLSGLEVTIDTTKYSQIESVVFEATLWVEGGNGRAWAKLKNVSDNNPFIEGQISSVSSTGELKTSGNIPIPTGSKKYGVQAKSDITNFAAHIDNARIKITLK